MSKTSKITVKHYLEKKVKPTLVYLDLPLGYPLYYRITYKRKTTNLKSFTGAVMTEKAYEHFSKTNEVYNYETNYTKHISLKLEKELFYIEKALQDIVNKNNDIEIFDEWFISELKTYFADLEESLLLQGWLKYRQYWKSIDVSKPQKKTYTVKDLLNKKFVKTDEEIKLDEMYKHLNEEKEFYQEQLYYCFNQEKTLFQCINMIKKITNFDLEPYISTDTLKYWHVIGLILIAYPRTIFIDFLINMDIDKIIKLDITENFVSNDEIKKICNSLKNNHFQQY